MRFSPLSWLRKPLVADYAHPICGWTLATALIAAHRKYLRDGTIWPDLTSIYDSVAEFGQRRRAILDRLKEGDSWFGNDRDVIKESHWNAVLKRDLEVMNRELDALNREKDALEKELGIGNHNLDTCKIKPGIEEDTLEEMMEQWYLMRTATSFTFKEMFPLREEVNGGVDVRGHVSGRNFRMIEYRELAVVFRRG
ncbi:MAG: hypothetical protein Q9220_006779 [cf. Caloplaca sp. 1 TL-2023]